MPLSAKRKLTVTGVVLGVILGAGLILYFVIQGLKGDIEDEKKRADAAESSLQTCEINTTTLRGAIQDQNEAIARAKEQSEQLRERQAEARADAKAAREEAEDAIATIRREQAESHSCEVARQKLIQEATGHEFE